MADSQIEKLQRLIAEQEIGYYLVLTQDAHNSEYVSPSDARRKFITGFTGSAGTAIIGKDGYAELATDARYWIQAGQQLGSKWVLRKQGHKGVHDWVDAISARAKAEKVAIGVDPRLISYQDAKTIMSSGATLKAIEPNLIDAVWFDKPAEPAEPVFSLDTKYSGQSRGSKLADVRNVTKAANADAIVLSALDEIAWMLNLRGSDIAYNPVFKSYLLITQTETTLYISEEHPLPPPEELSDITIKPYNDVFTDLENLSFKMDKKVWVPLKSSWALIKAAGIRAIVDQESPVEYAKAIKNPTEVDGADQAQLYCGLSVLRLLSWLQKETGNGTQISEFEASEQLQKFRTELPEFRGPSFQTISSSGSNAAIIHYAPSPEGSKIISPDEVYLVDSGSQFTYGTTDTTRTAWFGKSQASQEIREAYTLVLKGHIALATAVFPEGSEGSKLDFLARQPMQKYGYDYNHGTGHGVGSFLNVHEGPIYLGAGINRAKAGLEVGNILSNEPGIYVEGKFGIRIENLMVVEPAETKFNFGTKFLKFRTITIVPYDVNLIDTNLLNADEINWVNDYHRLCRKLLEPLTNGMDREYLLHHTEPIEKSKS